MARRRRSGGMKGIFSGLFSVRGLVAMAVGAFVVFFFPSLGSMVSGLVDKIKPKS